VSGQPPLVMIAGQIERVRNRRSELKRINLGAPSLITVTGDFAYRRTPMEVTSNTGKVDVFNITNGREGDLLILFSNPAGDEVKLKKSGGNILLNSDMKLKGLSSITLYYTASVWREVTRSEA
jgi:hypothetical protein